MIQSERLGYQNRTTSSSYLIIDEKNTTLSVADTTNERIKKDKSSRYMYDPIW